MGHGYFATNKDGSSVPHLMPVLTGAVQVSLSATLLGGCLPEQGAEILPSSS